MVQDRQSPLVVVTTQDAVYQSADNRNAAIARAFSVSTAVAGAIAVTGAAIIDRSIKNWSGAVVTAAPVSRNTTAARIAAHDVSATGRTGHGVSGYAITSRRMSVATLTISRMAGSQHIRRRRHATKRDHGSASDECSMKQASLLI